MFFRKGFPLSIPYLSLYTLMCATAHDGSLAHNKVEATDRQDGVKGLVGDSRTSLWIFGSAVFYRLWS